MLQPSHFILAWDRHQMCWLAYPVAEFFCYSRYWGIGWLVHLADWWAFWPVDDELWTVSKNVLCVDFSSACWPVFPGQISADFESVIQRLPVSAISQRHWSTWPWECFLIWMACRPTWWWSTQHEGDCLFRKCACRCSVWNWRISHGPRARRRGRLSLQESYK